MVAVGADNLPDWRDHSLGARVRAALWLVDQVGEGNTFTKQELRDAIPDREQVDRRLRDLRPAGWIIHTYRDIEALRANELLLERIGAPVWEAAHRGVGLRKISDKVRREILERDRFRCRRCGISAGEPYPDGSGEVGRLTIGHILAHKSGGSPGADSLLTECARCNETIKHLSEAQLTREQVQDRITELRGDDKRTLLEWMHADHRDFSAVEAVWAQYRQLPATEREKVTIWAEGFYHGGRGESSGR